MKFRVLRGKSKGWEWGVEERCGGFPWKMCYSQNCNLSECWDLAVNFFHGCWGQMAGWDRGGSQTLTCSLAALSDADGFVNAQRL